MALRPQLTEGRMRRGLGHPRQKRPAKARARDNPLRTDLAEFPRVLSQIAGQRGHAMASFSQGEQPGNRRWLMLSDKGEDRRAVQG